MTMYDKAHEKVNGWISDGLDIGGHKTAEDALVYFTAYNMADTYTEDYSVKDWMNLILRGMDPLGLDETKQWIDDYFEEDEDTLSDNLDWFFDPDNVHLHRKD